MAILKTKYMNPTGAIINPFIEDILSNPHCLIGGTTGSGKSVLLNNIIMSFLNTRGCNNSYILIDPKMTELQKYTCFPHCIGYTYDIQKAVNYLDWLIKEMEKRQLYMHKKGIAQFDGGHIYYIIDELADIMISPQKKDFKIKLQKVLQLGRASNIHVIACTQSPSRRVIPSEVVLNFTNRVALRCLSNIEYRQILNVSINEDLPKYGQAFYLTPGENIKRIYVELLTDTYYNNTVAWWKKARINPIKALFNIV